MSFLCHLCHQVELCKKIVFKQVSQKLSSSAIGQINRFPQEPQATGWANVTFIFRKTNLWMEGCIIRVCVLLLFFLIKWIIFRKQFFLMNQFFWLMNQSKTLMKWYHKLSSLQLIKHLFLWLCLIWNLTWEPLLYDVQVHLKKYIFLVTYFKKRNFHIF